MKFVIKGCKSWQLHTGAPQAALTIPCGKEQISQCQGKEQLLSGQRMVCKLCRLLRDQEEKTTRAAPPKDSRCHQVRLVRVMDSTWTQLMLELSWLQTNAPADEPNQIRAGCILGHHLSQRDLLIHLIQLRHFPNICF